MVTLRCRRRSILSAVAAAVLCCTLHTAVHGQRTASIIGNKVVYFPAPGIAGPIVEIPLPIPDDPIAVANGLTYQGQLPAFSQFVQLDDRGRVLFFVVDGNVYDRDGYVIAKTSEEVQGFDGYPYIDGRLKEGRGELVCAPVPGKCGMWYLIHSSEPNSTAPHNVGLSILDMDRPNPLFPTDKNRHGKLLAYEGVGAMDEVSGAGFDLYNFFGLAGSSVLPHDPSSLVRNGPVKLKALYVPSTSKTYLLVSTGFALAKYEMRGDRIQPLGYDLIPQGPMVDHQTVKGEVEAYVDNDRIVVALSYHTIDLLISDDPPITLLETYPRIRISELSTTSPTLAQIGTATTVFEPPIVINGTDYNTDALGRDLKKPGIGGIEFSENGRFIFWTKSYGETYDIGPVAHLSLYDRETNTTVPLEGVGLEPFLDGKLERHGGADGNDALYISGTKADGTHVLGALPITNFPAPELWVEQAFITSSVSLCADASLSYPDNSGRDPYHVLDKQGLNDRSVPILNTDLCCDTKHRITGFTDYTAEPGYQLWTGTSNPFYDLPEVRISGELRIRSGAIVVANDITFRFAPGAIMIIERGATFTSAGCTFTSGCKERWAGIRVEGKTNNPIQVQTGSPVDRRQGWLYLNGSTIENAEVGVWCARESAPGVAEPQYYGGVVRSVGSTFRNCTFGAKVENYTRLNGLTELNNLCFFGGTEFVTTGAFPNATWEEPKVHVTLTAVRGIDLFNCKFKNTAPLTFLDQRRGKGIQARIASFRVRGNADPNSSRFENLSIGITSRSSPLRPYEVDRTHFVNNMWGVYDLSSVASRITRNTFVVPDWNNFVRPPTGLYLHQSTRYLVEENTFQGFNRHSSFGIYFYGPQQAENRIYNNSFSNLMAGTMVSGRHKGNDAPFERQGLQILCGDYAENTFDYALGSYTYIREDQGDVVDGNLNATQLAGNRWLDAADGSVSFDIWIDTDQHDGQGVNPAPFFDYKRHNVAVCDPLIPSPFYSDQVQVMFTEFNKEVACGKGNLTPPPGPGTVSSRYLAVAAELKSAANHLSGVVNDGGVKLDIIKAIDDERPLLASHVLRDYLLARTPLEDDVLIAMLQRKTPMEAWHVTQVLLANCRLSSKVWATLDRVEYLSPYQLNLIANAENGSQVLPLLQQEIAHLSSQKAKLQTHLLYDLLTDSTTANKYSTVVGLLAPNADLGDQFYLAALHLMEGEYQLLDHWLDSMKHKSTESVSVLRTLFQIRQAEAATWPLVPATYASTLWDAFQEAEPGSALAAAMGYHQEFFDELPPIQIPDPTKSRFVERARSSSVPAGAPAFEVFPNPTNGTSYVVLQSEAGSQRQVILRDALGRLVQEMLVPQGVLLYELDLGHLASGLYSCEVVEAGASMGSLHVVVKK